MAKGCTLVVPVLHQSHLPRVASENKNKSPLNHHL